MDELHWLIPFDLMSREKIKTMMKSKHFLLREWKSYADFKFQIRKLINFNQCFSSIDAHPHKYISMLRNLYPKCISSNHLDFFQCMWMEEWDAGKTFVENPFLLHIWYFRSIFRTVRLQSRTHNLNTNTLAFSLGFNNVLWRQTYGCPNVNAVTNWTGYNSSA